MSRHLSPEIRVPIDNDNPAIRRNEDLCIRCGRCRDVCRDYISVLGYYDLSHTNDNAICIHCGQCANVCPTGSISETLEIGAVAHALKDPDKIVIFSTSPSVRVGLGEEFGMPAGSFVQGKMVALLRALGADYVLDTNFAADMTIMEEASELIERLKDENKPLPQFTSCCPAWVKFAETYYPELTSYISTAKSPIGMQGPTIKTYFAKKLGIDPRRIVNVAITPCTAKKYEIRREEMNAAGRYFGIEGMRDMDYVMTTRETARLAKLFQVRWTELEDSDYDSFMGEGSGAGVIFGNTGGVMEAAVRTAYRAMTGTDAPDQLYDLKPVRGMEGIREAELDIAEHHLRVAVIYGTANVRRFLKTMKETGKHYDFVEVMTCPGGCIGGGGQPKHLDEKTKDICARRIDSLYARDAQLPKEKRNSDTNEEIIALYKEFYGKPLSPLAKTLLHTYYEDKSSMLGEDAGKYKELKEEKKDSQKTGKKWKCRVCGYVCEGEQPTAECPVCHKDASFFDEVK